MSEGKDTEDLDAADDRLFSGKPLEELDEDTVIAVEAETEDGFDLPVEQEQPKEEQQQVEAQPAPAEEHADIQHLPQDAQKAIIAIRKDEAKKRKAAQEETQKLRDEMNQLKGRLDAQPAPQPAPQRQHPQIPNPATDPEGYHAYMMSQQQSALSNVRLDVSETNARQALGNEIVNEALLAVQNHPQAQALMAQFRSTQHPWGEMVNWHKQQKLMSEIGDDPEAYKLKLKEELMAEMQQQPGQQAPSAPQNAPNLPPRVANTPSAMSGGNAQHTMDDAEANLWGR